MRDYLVSYDDLYRLSREMFISMGFSENQAGIVANCLVEADARHLHSHGVAAMKTYMGNLKLGSLKPGAPAPSTLFETPLSLVLEGHSGIGYVIADYAVRRCIEKAKDSGVCIVTVRNANHYGFAGHWPEMMAQNGLIGLTSTNTVYCVCPTRSVERNLGTNPISVAFPVAGSERMFLLDMATCVMAHGKLCRSQIFAEKGAIPGGIVVDEEGKIVTDFQDALHMMKAGTRGGLLPLGGMTEELGGHKGYGLALLMELLTAGLSSGVPSKFIPLGGEGICFFFMAIDPALFGEGQKVAEHIAYVVEEYRKTKPIDPSLPVLIPGDKEELSRRKALENGIYLSPEIVDSLRDVAIATKKESLFESVVKKCDVC